MTEMKKLPLNWILDAGVWEMGTRSGGVRKEKARALGEEGKAKGEALHQARRKTKTEAEANNARKEERGGREPSSKRSAGWLRYDDGGGGGEEWVSRERRVTNLGGRTTKAADETETAGSVFGLGRSNSVQAAKLVKRERTLATDPAPEPPASELKARVKCQSRSQRPETQSSSQTVRQTQPLR